MWDDLRLDVQRLMCSGVFLKGAVSWLLEDRPVHTRFCQDDLVEMLSRMMFWNKLNESHWPKYVPERYYLAAEALLDDMEEQKVQPLFWGGLSATGDAEEELLPEDFKPEQDDKSKDADWNAADEGMPAEDVSEAESVPDSVTTSKQRKRRGSQIPGSDQPPAKRSRGGSRSLLAQKEYSKLTAAEKAMVESPEDGMVSWRHHGTRVKHADPSSTKNSQTLGFPAYSPNRHDLDLLKARFDPEAFHHLLTQVLSWRQMYDDRVQELYFHRLDDLSAAEVTFLDEMVEFMNGNSRAFWNALHWIMFLPGDADSLAYKIHTRRRRAQESVSKRAVTLAKRHKRNGVRESLFHEPGVWKYPAKVCHWILEDPSALQSHSLEEQLHRLDAAEPPRLQWARCTSDDDRIAHVPAEIRNMLSPVGQRDLISDAAP
ncbi:hypothetical protein PF010_g21100 [Phytophthora fragariae]|uniref:Uncharacterized protein n=1 Tax=Phytophthora fragariae TaxID=53985 RepID=A0A6G0KCA6_9STRA|nr:hypothetical protein PF010_g21100 [Phytophthora fragariae]KAE9202480.1 hypothetical protein PF004_g18411 [Phytophthora fragariae]